MKSRYNNVFDTIEPDSQKKQEAATKEQEKEVQVSTTIKTKKRFSWNIRRSIIAASTAAVLIFCAIFIPIISSRDSGRKPFVLTEGSDLMNGITPTSVNTRVSDEIFTNAVADFSLELFKNSFTDKQNSLISATSVLLALAMTTNGADGNTLAQMQKVLGKDLNIGELNEYLHSYVNSLPNEKKSRLEIANSIWFKENSFNVNRDFLQVNADYYNSAAYAAPFNDTTANDINRWVENSTDGLIDSIIDEIPADAIMYLINCVLFDAEWDVKYKKDQLGYNDFTSLNNQKEVIEFMSSEEKLYLEDDGAIGFIKPYYGKDYSFAAILPDKNTSIEKYVSTLTGEKFMNIVNNPSQSHVKAKMPKFEYEYELSMNDALKAMGINDAFSEGAANFSKMGTASGNIFISNVKHKSYISVDEKGTKAAAVTSVEISVTSVPDYQYVVLDRPFLYAIIDNKTNLPIIMGTYISPN